MGCETQSPPQKSCKKNLVATEAFISTFQEQVNTAIAAKQCDFQSVRLFSQDETRYGVFPVVSRRITLPGIKPIAEIDYRYESVYLYGAVETVDRRAFFLRTLTFDGGLFSSLSGSVFNRFPGKPESVGAG